MTKNDTPKSVKCSFCGKTQENVKKIVAGPGVYICNECVALCNEIIENENIKKLRPRIENYILNNEYTEIICERQFI